MVSSTSTGRSPRLLARPARVPRPRGARGTPERASRDPEARASPGDEMASAGKPPRGCASPPCRLAARRDARRGGGRGLRVAARCHLLVLFRGDAAWEGPGGDDDRDDEAREEASRRKSSSVCANAESACDAIARVAPVLEFTPLLVELGWDEKSARARADALARPSNDGRRRTRRRRLARSVAETSPAATCDGRRPRGEFREGLRGRHVRPPARRTRLLLLAAAALVTDTRSGTLYVGVTGEALLANKSDKNKIQPARARAETRGGFSSFSRVQVSRASMPVEIGPLDDAPPLASTVQDMCALVVSRETLAGAAAVNAQREARGFLPLKIVAVGVVGGVGDDDEARRRRRLLRVEAGVIRHTRHHRINTILRDRDTYVLLPAREMAAPSFALSRFRALYATVAPLRFRGAGGIAARSSRGRRGSSRRRRPARKRRNAPRRRRDRRTVSTTVIASKPRNASSSSHRSSRSSRTKNDASSSAMAASPASARGRPRVAEARASRFRRDETHAAPARRNPRARAGRASRSPWRSPHTPSARAPAATRAGVGPHPMRSRRRISSTRGSDRHARISCGFLAKSFARPRGRRRASAAACSRPPRRAARLGVQRLQRRAQRRRDAERVHGHGQAAARQRQRRGVMTRIVMTRGVFVFFESERFF